MTDDDSHVLARCTPMPVYWVSALVLIPFAGVIATSILVRPVVLAFGYTLVGRPLAWTMLCVGLVITACAYGFDYRRACYALTPRALLLGRGQLATRVAFEDIESVVIGLPVGLPWRMRWARFNPSNARLNRNVSELRAATVLIRLPGERVLPLCLAHWYMRDGVPLMQELVRRNYSKIVSAQTYTQREVAALHRPRFNRIRTVS